MAGIFGIGVSGIQAAQMGMLVSQHNITNSNTPGYNRQSVIQTTQDPIGFSSGFIGNGTRVATVARSYNQFLSDQVRQSDTVLSSLDTYFSQIQVVDDLLADANAGVSPALQNFFAGVQEVAAAPASLPARQSMLSAAQALVARFQGADQRISDLYGQANQQVIDNVALINTYGKQIATLNEQIIVAESAVNQTANDLQDKRDQLLTELNRLVKVQTTTESNGSMQVFIGKGQVLVSGTRASELAAVTSAADRSRMTVAMDLGGGLQELPEDVLSGGVLGGLFEFRSGTLDKALNSLGKVALNLAWTFNAQHADGMDMLGNSRLDTDSKLAADFFTIPSPKVIPSNPNSPKLTAFINPAQLQTDSDTGLPSDVNGGNYYTDINNSDYQLEYRAGTYRLTRLSDNAEWTGKDFDEIKDQMNNPDPLINKYGAQGFRLELDGPAADGDSYLIQPTREMAKNIQVNSQIAGDVRLIAAASPVRATVGLENKGSMQVAVTRMRADSVQGAAGGFPMTLGIDSSNRFTLYKNVGTGEMLDTANNYPFEMTVYPADGSTPSSFVVDDTTPGTWPEIKTGATYEVSSGYDRIAFKLTGNPQSGDTFKLQMNFELSSSGQKQKIGVSDSGNILLLGKLQTQKTGDGGASTYQSIYAQMVSDIGNKAREVEVTKNAQQALVDQASAARNAESGVNLDEEAANLLKYQQLYQASARSISIAQKLFDELLAIAG